MLKNITIKLKMIILLITITIGFAFFGIFNYLTYQKLSTNYSHSSNLTLKKDIFDDYKNSRDNF